MCQAKRPERGSAAARANDTALCGRSGLIICETYLDAGVSGGTLERPALQRLLADCRAGKIGTVIAQDLERLSRNPLV